MPGENNINIWQMLKMVPTDELDKLSHYVKMEQTTRKEMQKVKEIDARPNEAMYQQMNKSMDGGASVNPYAQMQRDQGNAAPTSQDVYMANSTYGM